MYVSEKHCLYCGAVIYQRNADKFCCHTCRGAYLRQQADLKRFKQIPDFEEKLKEWIKPIKIVVQRCYPYAKTDDDLDDFKQICFISLWKTLSNHPDKIKVGYLMKTFEMAIKEYCREQGKHSQHFIDEDAIFFANPEGIAEQREIIRKIVNDEKFKLLLAYSFNDKTEKEMAERMGISKGAFSYKIWEQRKILQQCLEN